MKKIYMIIIIISSLLTSGCFIKTKNLGEMFFPISLGIEYTDGEYKIYMQILNTSTASVLEVEGSQNETTFIVVNSKNKNISEAFDNLGLKSSSLVSAIKLKTIIFHKSIFEDSPLDYETICQYFVNNPIFRTKVQTYITDTDLSEFYSVKYMLSGTDIYSYLSGKNPKILRGNTKTSYLLDSLKNYSDNKRMYYFPIINVKEGNTEEGKEDGSLKSVKNYYYKGICYTTYNDKNIECLSEEEAIGFRWYSEMMEISINLLDQDSPIGIIVKKTDFKTKIKENKFYIEVKLKTFVNINLSSLSLDEITKKINDLVNKDIKNTLANGYNKSIDIYRLNDLAYRKHKNLKYNLENVEITIDSTIENSSYYKY